jgi:peptide/nickel transport system substrate-binding protein
MASVLVAAGALPTVPARAADDRPNLVIAVNKLPRGLEPAADDGNVDVRVTYSIFDTLIRRDFLHPGAACGRTETSVASACSIDGMARGPQRSANAWIVPRGGGEDDPGSS